MLKIIKNQFVTYIFILFALSFSSNAHALMHFTEHIYLSNTRCAYAGKILGIKAVDNADEVGVFVSDGNGGKILIGAGVMGDLVPGSFFISNIYGDDSTTDLKDGALDNETLIFIFWDNSENREYIIDSSNMSFEPSKGLTQPNIPPTFQKQTTFGFLNLKIKKINHPPTVSGDTLTVNEDEEKSGSLSGNDEDNDQLIFNIVQTPHRGTLVITDQNTGQYTYSPDMNYFGTDSFTFKVNDGVLDSNVGTIQITINPVNDYPIAENISLSINEDSSTNGSLKGSDIDGDSINYAIVNDPAKGSVSIINASKGSFFYTPQPNFNGNDSFTFKVNDGKIDSNVATVDVSINSVNDTPVSENSTLILNMNEEKKATLIATDVDQDSLTYHISSNGKKGTVTIIDSKTGAYKYIAREGEIGDDTFTFYVNDGQFNSNIANVNVTILQVTNPSIQLISDTNEITNSPRIPVTVQFSKPVTGFTKSDIDSNVNTDNFVQISNTEFTVELVLPGDSSMMTITMKISADIAFDDEDMGNIESDTFMRKYDPIKPSFDFVFTVSDYTSNPIIPLKVRFDEIINDFDSSDLTIQNGTLSAFQKISNLEYQFTITASENGLVVVEIPADAVVDLAGNKNDSTDSFISHFDSKSPSAQILSPTNIVTDQSPIPVTIIFNELVSGFEINDIQLTNCTIGEDVQGFSIGYNDSFLINIIPAKNGSISIQIPDNVCEDKAENNNLESNCLKRIYDSVIISNLTGYVVDQDASPIEGVNVLSDILSVSVTTDINGLFECPIPLIGRSYIFSFVKPGYITNSVNISSQNSLVDNILLFSESSASFELITGTCTSFSYMPIKDVYVCLTNEGYKTCTHTDDSGQFSLAVDKRSKPYHFLATKYGYESIEFNYDSQKETYLIQLPKEPVITITMPRTTEEHNLARNQNSVSITITAQPEFNNSENEIQVDNSEYNLDFSEGKYVLNHNKYESVKFTIKVDTTEDRDITNGFYSTRDIVFNAIPYTSNVTITSDPSLPVNVGQAIRLTSKELSSKVSVQIPTDGFQGNLIPDKLNIQMTEVDNHSLNSFVGKLVEIDIYNEYGMAIANEKNITQNPLRKIFVTLEFTDPVTGPDINSGKYIIKYSNSLSELILNVNQNNYISTEQIINIDSTLKTVTFQLGHLSAFGFVKAHEVNNGNTGSGGGGCFCTSTFFDFSIFDEIFIIGFFFFLFVFLYINYLNKPNRVVMKFKAYY
ncbi:outer membrane adhesin-like protein [Candidatus Magnetomorum sp. HK-1]|nr:outer membrane adhesin-like protein [Candidatus Magnetomorum sp. HK-1]